MKTKETKINEFVETLDASNEMNDKQFVSLSGAGLQFDEDQVEKNKNNTGCCNDSFEQA